MKINNLTKDVNKFVKKGDLQGAITYCQDLLVKFPSNADLHIKLGDLYMDWHLDIYQAKEYIDEAITEYQKAAEVFIDEDELKSSKSKSTIEGSEFKIKVDDKVITKGDIYYKIGFALYVKGELDKAINYFNLAIEQNSNISENEFMIANCLKKKDRFQDAIGHIDNALKCCFLNSSRIHYAKSRLLDSLYFGDRKKNLVSKLELILSWITLPFDSEAKKSVFNKFKQFPAFWASIKADVYLSQNRFDEAFEIYNKALEKMPRYPFLCTRLGDTYRKTGRLEEAVIEYKMALWIDPLCKQAYSGLVQVYEDMGDYDNAIEYYNRFIKINPNNAVLHSNIANLYFMKGETDKAVSHYQTAIFINPKPDWTSIVAQTLGYIEQNVIKNLDCAIANYQMANVLSPKEIDIYISLGSAFYDNEDYKNSLVVYRRALELEPNNSKIHCNLGYLYWGMGDLDEAIKEYRLSVKCDPTYDIAYNNLGVIYLDDIVHIQHAIDCFSKAIECNPNYALAYYNLGRCYELKNEKIEAAKYYQKAVDINNLTNEIDPQDIQDRLNNLFN